MRILSRRALLFCQVFIGFPLKYKTDSAGVTRLVFSPAVFWWGLTVNLLQSLFLCYDFYSAFTSQSPSELYFGLYSKVSLFVTMFNAGSTVLVELVYLLTYARKYPAFLEVCSLLEEFEGNMQLDTTKRPTVRVPIVAFSTVAPMILAGATQYFTSQRKGHDPIIRRILKLLFIVIARCGQTGMLIHFQQVAYSVAKGFHLLNSRTRLEATCQMFRQSLQLQQSSHSDHRWEVTSCRKVKCLVSAYQSLYDAMYHANVFYDDLLIAFIISMFFHITQNFYFIVLCILNEDMTNGFRMGVWIFCNISLLMLVILSSSDVADAAAETAPMICKLTTQDLAPGLKNELKSFLMTLSKQHVVFSASGYFDIKRQTLMSMAAAVTTYLVVMIQFELQSS
ncbi:gustatory receptor [Homalodisca vitripennis]|nr:gustatory receptor [Homalodisca vitripennis]